MRYRVTGDDGISVEVDAFDWMMAMVHAIDQLNLEVQGWVCETRADGSTKVTEPQTGRSWRVELRGHGVEDDGALYGRTVVPGQAASDDPLAGAAASPAPMAVAEEHPEPVSQAPTQTRPAPARPSEAPTRARPAHVRRSEAPTQELIAPTSPREPAPSEQAPPTLDVPVPAAHQSAAEPAPSASSASASPTMPIEPPSPEPPASSAPASPTMPIEPPSPEPPASSAPASPTMPIEPDPPQPDPRSATPSPSARRPSLRRSSEAPTITRDPRVERPRLAEPLDEPLPQGRPRPRPRPRRAPDQDRPKRRAKASEPLAPSPAIAPAPERASATAAPDDLAERIFMMSMDLSDVQSVEEACRRALKIVLELVPCEAGSVLKGSLNDDHLTFVAVAGPTASQLRGQRIPFGTGIVGASFDLGISIEVSNVASDPRHANQFDRQSGFTTRAVLCVPIQGEELYYGAIQILNPPGDHFEEWHRDVTQQVADSLASTLDAVLR